MSVQEALNNIRQQVPDLAAMSDVQILDVAYDRSGAAEAGVTREDFHRRAGLQNRPTASAPHQMPAIPAQGPGAMMAETLGQAPQRMRPKSRPNGLGQSPAQAILEAAKPRPTESARGDLAAGMLQARQIPHGMRAAAGARQAQAGMHNQAMTQAATGEIASLQARMAQLEAERSQLTGRNRNPERMAAIDAEMNTIMQRNRQLRLAVQDDSHAQERIQRSTAQQVGGLAQISQAGQQIQELQGQIDQIPLNEAARQIGQAETFGEGWQAFKGDPLGAMRSFTLRSLPSSVPTIGAAVAGSIVGSPAAGAMAAGGVGAAVEYGSSVAQEVDQAFRENGVDPSDPDATTAMLESNPGLFSEIAQKARARAAIIGGADAVSGGVGGQIAKAAAGTGRASRAGVAAASGAVIEPAMEGAGEALAGYATEGEVSPGEVMAEMIGGAGQGAVQTTGQVAAELRRATPQGKSPGGLPVDQKADQNPSDSFEPFAPPQGADTAPGDNAPESGTPDVQNQAQDPEIKTEQADTLADASQIPFKSIRNFDTAQALFKSRRAENAHPVEHPQIEQTPDAMLDAPSRMDQERAAEEITPDTQQNIDDAPQTLPLEDHPIPADQEPVKKPAPSKRVIENQELAPSQMRPATLPPGERLSANATHDVAGSDGKRYRVQLDQYGDVVEAVEIPRSPEQTPNATQHNAPKQDTIAAKERRYDQAYQARPQISPEQRPQILQELRTRLDKLGLADVRLGVLDGSDGATGRFQSGKDGMQILVDVSHDPARTLDHEAVHALKAMNLFTPQEWAALEAKAPEWVKRLETEQAYPDASPDVQTEEAIAEAYARWAAKPRKAEGLIGRAFDRVRRLLKALRETITGQSLPDAQEIFHRIDRGEIGKRDRARNTEMVTRMRNTTGPFAQVDDRLLATLKDLYQSKPLHQAFDAFMLRFVDSYRPWSAVGKEFGVDREGNPYDALTLIDSKAGAALERITELYRHPIAKLMGRHELSQRAVSAYLMQQHADERDASIRKRFNRDNGSGLSASDRALLADELAKATPEQRAALGKISDLIAKMHSELVDLRQETHLLTPSQARNWRKAYLNYVPLKGQEGFATELDGTPAPGIGNSVKGVESKEAFGRDSMASLDELLPNIFAQADEAIVRAHKNEAGVQIWELVIDTPDPARWVIEGAQTTPTLNVQTGMIEYREAKHQLEDDAIAVKINGATQIIRFTDKGLARAFNKAGFQNLHLAVRMFRFLTGTMASALTRYSGTFLVANAVRDTMAATFMADKYRHQHKGIKRDLLKGYLGAAMAIGRDRENLRPEDKEWHRYAEEFHKSGGITAFALMKDLHRQHTDIERMAREFQPSLKGKALHYGKTSAMAYFRIMDRLSGATENALRLSLYRSLRERGVGIQEAANEAKDLTVNFNRRGEWSSVFGSFFMFTNAAVQGSANLIRNAKHLHRPFVALALLGAASDLINALLMGEDDEWDRVDDYVKQRNLVIPNLFGDSEHPHKIPLPYGFSTFFNLGRLSAAYGRGALSGAEVFSGVLSEVGQSWSPVGGLSALTIIPSALKPAYEVYTNENTFFGGQIVFEDSNRGPLSHQSTGTESWVAQDAAKALNAITGGSAFAKGLLDLHPKHFDHLMFGYTGTLGRDIATLADTLNRSANGVASEIAKQPVIRAFVGSNGAQQRVSAAYQVKDEAEDAVEQMVRQIAHWAAQHGRQHPNDNPKRLIRQLSRQGLPREIRQAYEADLDLMKLGGMSDKLAGWAIKAGVKAGQTQTKPPWFNWHTMSNVSGPAKDYAKAMSKLTDARRAAANTRSGADYYRELDRIERKRDAEARKLLEAAGAL